MPHSFRSVDLGFFESAPCRFTGTGVIHHPAERVFAAIADDPASWGDWFPGFSRSGRYVSPPPYGAGAVRDVAAGGIRLREKVLTWERPYRWAFCIDEASIPLARALAEDYQVTAEGKSSVLRWTVAMDPAPLSRPLVPVMKRVVPIMIGRVAKKLDAYLAKAGPAGSL
jgi:hypothetical protein